MEMFKIIPPKDNDSKMFLTELSFGGIIDE